MPFSRLLVGARARLAPRASRRLVVAGLLSGLLPALPLPAAAQDTVTVATARGEVSVPARPRTVVVFDLPSIDTLDALGVEIAGVPQGPIPTFLEKYTGKRYAKVGTLFEPDLEAVAALKPDLIIAGGRSQEKTETLSAIAPTIDMTVPATDFVGGAVARVEALATIFGKEAEARTRIDALRSSITALKAESATVGTGLIVLTTGNRMSAFGPGSRFGVLHSEFGIAPADTGLDTANHGEAVSFEYIAKTDPDWLFVIDRDAAIGRGSAAAMLKNELVENTKAWKADQVVYLDPANWYLSSSGLQAMQKNVDELATALARRS